MTRGANLKSLFFLSGFSGLAYEILWQKQFILHLGAAAPSVVAVLAAFFTGIAFGGKIGDALLSRSRMPALKLYACAELVVAANALLMPFLQAVLFSAYFSAAHHSDPTGAGMQMFRFLLCCLGVLPATLAMGATIPFMAAALDGEDSLSVSYGVNAAGAMLGALLTTFMLVPAFGIRGSTYFALVLNLAAAGGAFLFAKVCSEREAASFEPVPKDFAWIYFFAGFLAIGAETVWMRILAILTTNGSILFAITLAVFLGAYTLGSLVLHPFLISRGLTPKQEAAWLQLGAAMAILLTIPLARLSPMLLNSWVRVPAANGDPRVWSVIAHELYCVIVLMALPAAAMGAVFPALARAVESAGTLYFWGNLGSLAATVFFGLLLVPAIGLNGSLSLLAILCSALAFKLHWRSTRMFGVLTIVLALLVWATLPPFVKDIYEQKLGSDGRWYESIDGRLQDVLLRYKEGMSATIAVREAGKIGDENSLKRVYVDEQLVASTDPDAIVDSKMLAHLPALLHPAPKKALSVGYGSGGTSWSLTLHPGLEARTVEIEQEVLNSAQLFRYGLVWNEPRFRAIHDDARDHLATTLERYDFISTDVTNLQYKQNASLYSVEYFKLMRDRLTPNGIACAWIPVSAISPDEFKILLRTFQEVFPHASLWIMNASPTFFGILIGTPEPLKIDMARVRAGMASPQVAGDLSLISINDPIQIPSFLLLDEVGMRRYTEGAKLHTDDDPVLEHRSSYSFYVYVKYFKQNLAEILRFRPESAADFVLTRDRAELEAIERAWKDSKARYLSILQRF